MDDGSQAGVLLTREDGRPVAPGMAMAPAIRPLNVSGLVVAKADLVAALRLYVPQTVDIESLGGERFLLVLAAVGPGQPVVEEE